MPLSRCSLRFYWKKKRNGQKRRNKRDFPLHGEQCVGSGSIKFTRVLESWKEHRSHKLSVRNLHIFIPHTVLACCQLYRASYLQASRVTFFLPALAVSSGKNWFTYQSGCGWSAVQPQCLPSLIQSEPFQSHLTSAPFSSLIFLLSYLDYSHSTCSWRLTWFYSIIGKKEKVYSIHGKHMARPLVDAWNHSTNPCAFYSP